VLHKSALKSAGAVSGLTFDIPEGVQLQNIFIY